MEHLDPRTLSAALLDAPGWARVGLTAPTAKLREQAAHELVATLLNHLNSQVRMVDENQLWLPI